MDELRLFHPSTLAFEPLQRPSESSARVLSRDASSHERGDGVPVARMGVPFATFAVL